MAELYAGVREGEERVRLERFLQAFEIIPLDLCLAVQEGLYRRDYSKSHNVGLADALIAATAIRQLSDTIIIPPGVLDEVAEGQFVTPQAYVQHYGIVDLIDVRAVSQSERLPEVARLHVGEAQAIQLSGDWRSPSSLKKQWSVGWPRGWASPSRGLLGKF